MDICNVIVDSGMVVAANEFSWVDEYLPCG